jgi:hypothetical protein
MKVNMSPHIHHFVYSLPQNQGRRGPFTPNSGAQPSFGAAHQDVYQ